MQQFGYNASFFNSERSAKPFSFSSAPSLWEKKKRQLKTKPRALPQVPSFKLPSRSLWLLRGPWRDDLFCFASLVPSVVRAGLSVPQHGNVMVARGGWRCFCSRGLWTRPAPSPRFLVRDPRDTRAVAVFTDLFTHLGTVGAQMCFACTECCKFGGVIFNWYREVVWKFLKLWQSAPRWKQVARWAPNLFTFGSRGCRFFSQQGNMSWVNAIGKVFTG